MSVSIGSLGAIFQKSLKRFLAYTAINNMGFLFTKMNKYRESLKIYSLGLKLGYSLNDKESFKVHLQMYQNKLLNYDYIPLSLD